MQLFNDPLHNMFGTTLIASIKYGGPEAGEIEALAKAIGPGDDTAFYLQSVVAADRLMDEAEVTARKAHASSSAELLLRAACFYGLAFKPLYGTPVDPRLKSAYEKEVDAFHRALPNLRPSPQELRIPYDGATLPAYFVPALNRESETRPLIIFTAGYDSNAIDSYFQSAVAASQRGYHTLMFDGPGQGELLIERDVVMRPDWEVVVRAVVDFAMTLANVDTERIALNGISLGGYLALRAASGESRLAACIADPGLAGMLAGFAGVAAQFGLPADSDPTQLDDATLQAMTDAMTANRQLHWSILRRGFWVTGAQNLREFFQIASTYTLAGRTDEIRCPTLIAAAEADPLSSSAESLYEALHCPKTFIRFTSAEGAGTHCETQNRSLFNLRALDWLDTIFQR
jgi:alpha-beta hydrolase superfamily lysophospholipase